MHVTVGSGVLSVNGSGTDVVLARFPSSGTLSSFGLTTSAIKTIAIPNALQEWPTSALNGCTALEQITTFGEELSVPLFTVVRAHFEACTNLKHVQIPSSAEVGSGSCVDTGSIFQHSIQSVVFPASTRQVGYAAFFRCNQLISADLSRCAQLTTFVTSANGNGSIFSACSKLEFLSFPKNSVLTGIGSYFYDTCGMPTSLDLSGFTNLQTLKTQVFHGNKGYAPSHLAVVILPASLKEIQSCAFAYYDGTTVPPPNLRTIIWKGCSARPSGITIASDAFGNKTLDTLVSEKTVQEIFVP